MYYYKRNILTEILPEINNLFDKINAGDYKISNKIIQILEKIDIYFNKQYNKNDYLSHKLSLISYTLNDIIKSIGMGVNIYYIQMRLQYIIHILE